MRRYDRLQQQAAAKIGIVLRLPAGGHFVARAEVGHKAVDNSHAGVFKNAAFFVLGDNKRGVNKCLAGAHGNSCAACAEKCSVALSTAGCKHHVSRRPMARIYAGVALGRVFGLCLRALIRFKEKTSCGKRSFYRAGRGRKTCKISRQRI